MKNTNLYKTLIVLELAVSLLSSVTYRPLYYTVNGTLITAFERYRDVTYDIRLLNSPIVLILEVILIAYIYYGMWTYKNHARWLYVLVLPVSSIIITYLSGTSLAHPVTVVLRNTVLLLEGAIIALSFSEPISNEFKKAASN